MKEEKACQYLLTKGLRILFRNFKAKTGEIDIIAKDKECLVFVEVKYKGSRFYGEPYEKVNYQKQLRISKTAQYFLIKYGLSDNIPCRFDVISIAGDEISWIRDAFTCRG